MRKIIAIGTLIVFAWLFGLYAFVYQQDFIKSLFYTISVFFGSLKEASDLGKDVGKLSIWQSLYVPAIIGLLAVVWAVVALYLKLFGKSLKEFWLLNFCEPILVIGLGEGNSAYIDSELESGNNEIIVIERDANNRYLSSLKSRVMSLTGDAKEIIKRLKFERIKHIVISVGDDLENIAIAKEILLQKRDKEIFLHINDRELKDINFLGSVLGSNNIHIFSYYASSARELFLNNNIVSSETINSNNRFDIAIIGDKEFVLDIFYQSAIMGQLPNENRFKINIITNSVGEIKSAIDLNYNIQNIPNMQVEYIEVDINQKEFYELKLWKSNELEHIIFCFDDAKKSIKAFTLLNQREYIDTLLNGDSVKVKIDIAISNSNALSYALQEDREKFKLLNIFAETTNVSSKENLIAKERDKIAIGVDFVYSNVGIDLIDYDNYTYSYYLYDGNKEIKATDFLEINNSNWQNLSHFHKESNRAVADHLLIKLQYLGLELHKSNINNKEKLLKKNEKIFFDVYDNDKKVALAKSEHNRWMALHYLHGYKKVDFVSKEDKKKSKNIDEAKKEHMCLVPFEEFKERSDELVKLGYGKGAFEGYDIMIVEFIPNIVTFAGFEIVKINKRSLK